MIIVPHDGHLGVPSGENCLLLLNVVASKTLNFTNPDLDPMQFSYTNSINIRITPTHNHIQENTTKEIIQPKVELTKF